MDWEAKAKEIEMGQAHQPSIDWEARAKLVEQPVQQEYTPTDENSTITGQPKMEWTPTGEPSTSLGALVKSGFQDAPEAKISTFAKSRGIPEDRYSIDGGEIVYRGEDGKKYPETKNTIGGKLKRIVGEQIPRLPEDMTAGALVATGHPWLALPATAAVATARQWVGDVFFGDKDSIAEQATDVGITTVFAGLSILGAKAFRTGAEGIKLRGGLVQGKKKAGLRIGMKSEIENRLISPREQAKAEFVGALAKKHGVDLPPHQLYDKEGMTNIWKYLRKHPQTSDAMQVYEKQQDAQVNRAVLAGVKDITQKEDVTAVGHELIEEAGKAARHPIESRTKATGPIYEKAKTDTTVVDTGDLSRRKGQVESRISKLESVGDEVDLDAMVGALNKQKVPTMMQKAEGKKGYQERILSDYKRLVSKDVPIIKGKIDDAGLETLLKEKSDIGKTLAGQTPPGFDPPTKQIKIDTSDAIKEIKRLQGETVPDDPSFKALTKIEQMIKASGDNLGKLDRVKKTGIDNILNKSGTTATMSREMTIVKKALVDAMDLASPEYSKARKTHGLLSGRVKAVDRSIIGTLSRLKSDDQATKAVGKLLSTENMTPFLMREARRTLNNDRLIRDAVGVHILKTYKHLKKTEEGKVRNAAGKMVKQIFGTEDQQDVLKEALDPVVYKNLKGLLTVLEKAAIGKGGESMTMPFAAIHEKLSRSAGGLIARTGKGLMKPIVSIEQGVFNKWNDLIVAGNQEKLMKSLTSSNVTEVIGKLERMSPKEIAFFDTAGTLMGMLAAGGVIEKGKRSLYGNSPKETGPKKAGGLR